MYLGRLVSLDAGNPALAHYGRVNDSRPDLQPVPGFKPDFLTLTSDPEDD
jgi:hypothetical protein